MVPPDRRTRARGSDRVIDLRQAAATRNRVPASGPGVPTPGDVDLAAADRGLLDAVRHHAGPGALAPLHELGRHVGSVAQRRAAADVEAAPPRLQVHDERGDRVDRVVVHPGWRTLQHDGHEAGLAGHPWQAAGEAHAHLLRAAGLLLWAQSSASSAMALSTHHAATAAVAGTPAAARWLPRLASRRLAAGRSDPGGRRAPTEPGASAGVALTERSSSAPEAGPTTRATVELGGPVDGGPTWRLSGRKWFVGNADADVLLTSAATDSGPGVFLLPRRLGDGSANGVRTQRLRPGPAYRAWVVGDLDLDDAWAVRLDDPAAQTARAGRDGADAPEGQRRAGDRPAPPRSAALQAVRDLDATVLAAAGMRGLLSRAGHHARHRVVPGGPLDTVPLMRTVLADMAVESEATTVLAMHLAATTDTAQGGSGADEAVRAAALLRLAGPVAALWTSRRAPQVAQEAVECLGSAGWDDGGEVARLQRDVGALLAGRTGNGLALEVVRVVAHDPDAVEAFVAECGRSRGDHPRLDAAVDACTDLLRTASSEARQDPAAVQGAARWLGDRLAVTLQAALVVRSCPDAVADAYLAARLDSSGARGLGGLPLGSHQTALVLDRALSDA